MAKFVPRAAVLCYKLTKRQHLNSSPVQLSTTPSRRPRHITAMAATPKPIPKLKLGSSDLMVSNVCLGTMTFGTAGSAAVCALRR